MGTEGAKDEFKIALKLNEFTINNN